VRVGSVSSLALGPRLQLALVAVLVAVALLAYWLLGRDAALPHEAEVAAPPPGTFRPTQSQWEGLVLAPVMERVFRAEEIADGAIAIDDDLTTPIFSPYSGRVTKLFAKAGDEVKAGAPLLAVNAAEFVQGQNDLLAAHAALNTARAQQKLTAINAKRQAELYQAKGASLRDREQAEADLAAANAALATAETALAAVRNRLRILGKSDEEIAGLETARKMNPEAIVTAPIEGTVTQRQVGLGQFIQSGASNPVFAIGNLRTAWLVAYVREADAPHIRLGDPVEVRVLAFPERIFKAKLSYIAPMIDPATHRLAVRADVENADGALKPQMFASFSILTGPDRSALAVPDFAVLREGNEARVWVEAAGHTLALRPIRVGRVRDGLVEVVEGLALGDKIVTSGTIFIDRAAKGE